MLWQQGAVKVEDHKLLFLRLEHLRWAYSLQHVHWTDVCVLLISLVHVEHYHHGPGLLLMPALRSWIWTRPASVAWSSAKKALMNIVECVEGLASVVETHPVVSWWLHPWTWICREKVPHKIPGTHHCWVDWCGKMLKDRKISCQGCGLLVQKHDSDVHVHKDMRNIFLF